MQRELRKNKRSFRTSDEENEILSELKMKFGYGKTTPTIEMIFDLFNKVEEKDAEIFKLKCDQKTISEIEKENQILNFKLNLNLEILKQVFDLSDEEFEKIKIKSLRKNKAN